MKLLLALAFLIPSFAFAEDVEDVANTCEAQTLATAKDLETRGVSLTLAQSLQLFKDCILTNLPVEQRECGPKDDRCYP